MSRSIKNNEIAFIYFNEEFCHFGTFQGSSEKLWTEYNALYTRIGFTPDGFLFGEEALGTKYPSVNLMEDPNKIDAELKNVQKHFLIRQWDFGEYVANFSSFDHQFCWSLMANYIVEKFLSRAKAFEFGVTEIYVFIPSTVHSEVKNLINSLFKLEFPSHITLKFFDSNDIIPQYLKYSVSQDFVNGRVSKTKPQDYIILNRDLHHTFIKYFKLVPIDQQSESNGKRYPSYHNVQEVASIMLNHGNYEIEETIKEIIGKRIETDGKPEFIKNYSEQEVLKNVRSTKDFGYDSVSSICFKYDMTEWVKISYEDFLKILLPKYYKSEIDTICKLSNEHASEGIVPTLHLYGIIHESILHRYLEENMTSEIANYRNTNGVLKQLIKAAASVIIANFDDPTFLPKRLTLGVVDVSNHEMNKMFRTIVETNQSALSALNKKIQKEKLALRFKFNQDIKVWNKYYNDLKEYCNYYPDAIEIQWREATRDVCSDDELQAAIKQMNN